MTVRYIGGEFVSKPSTAVRAPRARRAAPAQAAATQNPLREYALATNFNETLCLKPVTQSYYSPITIAAFDRDTGKQITPNSLCKEYLQDWVLKKYTGQQYYAYGYTTPEYITRSTQALLVIGVPSALLIDGVADDLRAGLALLSERVKEATVADPSIDAAFGGAFEVLAVPDATFNTAALYSTANLPYTDPDKRRVIVVQYPECWERHPSLYSLMLSYLRSGYAVRRIDVANYKPADFGNNGMPLVSMYGATDVKEILKVKLLRSLLSGVSKPGYSIEGTYKEGYSKATANWHAASGTSSEYVKHTFVYTKENK